MTNLSANELILFEGGLGPTYDAFRVLGQNVSGFFYGLWYGECPDQC